MPKHSRNDTVCGMGIRISDESFSVLVVFTSICAVAACAGYAIITAFPSAPHQPSEIARPALAAMLPMQPSKESTPPPVPEAALSKDRAKLFSDFDTLFAFQEYMRSHPQRAAEEISAWLNHMQKHGFHRARMHVKQPMQVHTLPMVAPTPTWTPQPTSMAVPPIAVPQYTAWYPPQMPLPWPTMPQVTVRSALPAQPAPARVVPSQSTYIEHAQAPETPKPLADTSRWSINGSAGCPASLGNACR